MKFLWYQNPTPLISLVRVKYKGYPLDKGRAVVKDLVQMEMCTEAILKSKPVRCGHKPGNSFPREITRDFRPGPGKVHITT